MPFSLLKLASEEGIAVEYWEFPPPIDGIYLYFQGLPPIIGLSKSLFNDRVYFRCVLAEELGHHFTTSQNAIPRVFFHYRDRLKVTRAEYRAMCWASLRLVPLGELLKAVRSGIQEVWELAEHFDVTEEMMNFRLRLPDIYNGGVFLARSS